MQCRGSESSSSHRRSAEGAASSDGNPPHQTVLARMLASPHRDACTLPPPIRSARYLPSQGRRRGELATEIRPRVVECQGACREFTGPGEVLFLEQLGDRAAARLALGDEEQPRSPAVSEVRAVVPPEAGVIAVQLDAGRRGLLGVVDRRGAGLVLDEVAAVVAPVLPPPSPVPPPPRQGHSG